MRINLMPSSFSLVFVFLLLFSAAIMAVNEKTVRASNTSIALSNDQIHEYETHGLLIIPHFFSKQEVEQVSTCATRLQKIAENLSQTQQGKVMEKGTQFVIDRIGDKVQIHRIVWAGAAEPQLLELARQPKLLIPVSQILGSKEADHLINQLHYKLPNDAVEFTWHQDIKNRRMFDPEWKDVNHRGSFVQTLIAIDPVRLENGPIYYVPNSHTQGDFFLEKITDERELNKLLHLDKAVPLLLNPGDVVFMHPLLVHGSKPNESSMSRRIFINGFAYPGANKKPYPGEGSAQRIVLQGSME